MKTIIVAGGIRHFLNNQEWEFLEGQEFPIEKNKLNENEMVIASNLYKRGVLSSYRKENSYFYVKNKNRV